MKKDNHPWIRPFREEDATQVSAVIRKTLLETNTADYPSSIIEPLRDYFSPTKVLILASERFCVVAICEDKIVGTGAIENGELKTIFVLPYYQGRGVGRKILGALERHANELSLSHIKVPSSISGIGFYEKLGYQKGVTFMSKHAGQQTWMVKDIRFDSTT